MLTAGLASPIDIGFCVEGFMLGPGFCCQIEMFIIPTIIVLYCSAKSVLSNAVRSVEVCEFLYSWLGIQACGVRPLSPSFSLSLSCV